MNLKEYKQEFEERGIKVKIDGSVVNATGLRTPSPPFIKDRSDSFINIKEIAPCLDRH